MDETLKPNYYAMLLAILKPKYSVDKCMTLMGIRPSRKDTEQQHKKNK